MASSNVIRSFLVNLGFRTDENSLRNFTGGINRATAAVGGLSLAVETMVATVVYGVQRFASNLEALYFASKRTSSSATELMALDRTMQNFGMSAGETLGSIENLARLLRQNPGYEGMLSAWGVQVKHLKDGTVDAGDAFRQLAGVFRNMPIMMAEQLAAQFGISDKMLMAMRDPTFDSAFAQMQKRVANQGLQKATEDAHRFMVALRDLTVYLQAFGIKVWDILQNRLGLSFEKIERWLDKNGPHLADELGKVVTALITLAEKMGPLIVWVIDKFMELDKTTGGLSTKLLAAWILLSKFGGFQIIGGIFGLVRAFAALATGIGGVVTIAGTLATILGGSAVLDFVKLLTGQGPGGIGSFINNKIQGTSFGQSIGDWFGRVGSFLGITSAQDAMARENPMQFLLDQARGQLTREQVAGLLANIKAESGFNETAKNPKSTAFGLAQWTQSSGRQEDFKRWAGKDIHESSISEQYRFMLYELLQGKQQNVGRLLQAQTNAANAARVIDRQYEANGLGQTEEDRRAALATAMVTNNNTFNITESKDPKATARAIQDIQNRQLAQVTRNAATAQ